MWVFFVYCHHCLIAWPVGGAPEALQAGFCREEGAITLGIWKREGTPIMLLKQKQL